MRLLCDENLWGASALLEGLGERIALPGRDIRPEHVVDADALLVRSQTRIDAELLGDTHPRFVGTATAGHEHVDTALLAKLGIPFANAPGCNAEPVADWVMGVVALAMLEARLAGPRPRCGIVGCGEVGGRVARRLEALGCEVLCVDPPRVARGAPLPGRAATLDEVLDADLLTFHVPLVTEGPWPTRGLLDATRIAALRPESVLVNAARGGVVDDAALLGRMRSDDLFVALDVYEQEPTPPLELLRHCRVATPHVAGHSIEGKARGTAMIRDAMCATLDLDPGVPLGSVLPPLPPAERLADEREAVLRFVAEARTLVADTDAFRRARAAETTAGRAFDDLRRTYDDHRDFSARRVETSGASAALLRAMGFRVLAP